ncbi:MAG: GTPase [Gammaproteobacteria bacterium]|uniref:YcjF family protein n=1 Tax=Rhodoferax sp. TaxID=50421 RepID=UPI001827F489|nr:DUF533 domain-containing protein [Rhodoferax sp.]MBU3900217.1 GTPase [Gammaproteobacteria bacterium]MBA3058795.1 GTPase [Rhodoferax sp.]MBU3999541.1 GTPase [Gammaproteobacteria bacterium]MBU4082281.1 GTPase [Gammaproteobacteria bacterium]MBU4114154.1 GTPase [Gammaproteobacteria bacterium]
MTPTDQKSLLTIALFAAFSDGNKAEAEREEIRRIAASLGSSAQGLDMATLYQDVLLKRTSVAAAAHALQDADYRQLAYEMAVCVCDADGQQTAPEQQFLATLKQQLQLGDAQTQVFDAQAQALAVALPVAVAAPTAYSAASDTASSASDALDKSILNYAILNGALELLPQSWASMAIIPLQVKMVYAIGKAHGIALDQGHIREFIAAAGVGLSSQYIEQFGRKLLGGLLGKVAGRAIGSLGSAATGMAFSFATTYALGQVAKRYYSGGRVMSTELLRNTFQDLMGPAKQLQSQYLPQIQQKASTLNPAAIMAMVRS